MRKWVDFNMNCGYNKRKDNKISHYQPACRQAGIQFPMKFQMSNLNICIYWYH